MVAKERRLLSRNDQKTKGLPAEAPRGNGSQIYPLILPFLTIVGLNMLFFWFFSSSTPFIIPFAMSIFACLVTSDRKMGVLLAASGVFAGTALAVSFLTPATLLNILQTLPPYAHADIPVNLVYRIVFNDATRNPIMGLGSFTEGLGITLGMSLGAGMLTYLWVLILKKYRRPVVISVLGVMLVSAALGLAVLQSSEGLIPALNQEPQSETYSYDPIIYLKMFHNMKHGENYYSALVSAALDDRRVDSLENWLFSPMVVREPMLFYFWRYFAPNGSAIFFYSLFFTVLVTVILILGLSNVLPAGWAYAACLSIFPYLFMAGSWWNILFPDWWAALLVLASIGLLCWRKYTAAVLLALMASLVRETTALLLLSYLVAAVLARKRSAALLSLGAAVVFGALYAWHYSVSSSLLAGAPTRSLEGFVKGFHAQSVLGTTSYLMFPYGYFLIPPVVIFLVGIFGSLFIRDKAVRVSVSVYLLGFGVYPLLMKTSSYWGQKFLPLSLISVVVLISHLDSVLLKTTGSEPRPSSESALASQRDTRG